MKRSEVNAIIREADAFLKRQSFYLPPFAHWGPEAWAAKGPEVREIVDRRLGWDITDFGQGDFKHIGLAVFTLRNGAPDNLKSGRGKVYAEKILIVEPGQVTPMHFHWIKMEDIINRGGGKLAIKLYNANPDNTLAGTDVTVTLDGVTRTLKAGETVVLLPGESITLVPYCAHEFWAEESRALVGEVSSVNDDNTDNCFVGGVGRFPAIEEDVPPLYLLVNDYERYYFGARG
jgi:D-lyxose ketol-isomerase